MHSFMFLVSFFLPFAFQPPYGQPPVPTDDSLILRMNPPALTVAVLYFEGSPDQETLIAQADELNDLLFVAEMKYDENNWFYAGYDPPSRVQGRHNEIWIELFDTATPQQLTRFQVRNYAVWLMRGGSVMALVGVVIHAVMMYRAYHGLG